MPTRGLFLLGTMLLAVTLAACGRASDDQIDQALGIEPTPTLSAEAVSSATAAANAAATERAVAVTGDADSAPARGDASRGQRQFTTQCIGCHRPGGSGPNILEAGGTGADVSPESLLALVRDGVGHPEGLTYRVTEISNGQVDDLAAYILSRAGQ